MGQAAQTGAPSPGRGPGEDESQDSVRDILRHSWIYSLAPVLQRLLAIVLIRLYTTRLSPAEFGVLDLLDLVLTLLPQLIGVNILSGLTRFYYEHKDPRRRALVVSSTTLALSALAFLVSVLVLFAREPLTQLLFQGSPSGKPADDLLTAVTLSILIVPFSLVTTSGLRYLQVLKRSRASTWIQVSKTLLEATLKLVALFVLDWGVPGFLAAILLGEFLTATCFAVWMGLRLRTGFDWTVFRPVLSFALPLLPLGIVQLGLHYFGRVALEHAGPTDPVVLPNGDLAPLARQWLGIFGLGFKVAFLVHSAVLAPFMQIWQPHVFGLSEGQRRGEMVRLGNWAMAALCAIYLPVAVFGRQAVDLLSGAPEFRAAWRVTPLVVLAYLAYASYAISQVALLAQKRTWPLLWMNLAALGLGVAAAFLLVSRAEQHGYAAAALACGAALLPLAVGTELWARSEGLATRGLRGTLVPLCATAFALAGAGWVDRWRDPLDPGALLPVLALKAAIVAAVWFSLWRLGVDSEGRDGLARLARDGLTRLRRR